MKQPDEDVLNISVSTLAPKSQGSPLQGLRLYASLDGSNDENHRISIATISPDSNETTVQAAALGALAVGSSYVFRVCGFNKRGEGPLSDPTDPLLIGMLVHYGRIKLSDILPQERPSLSCRKKAATAIEITVQPGPLVEGASRTTSYKIEYCPADGGETRSVTVASGASPRILVQHIQPTLTYNFTCLPGNRKGWGTIQEPQLRVRLGNQSRFKLLTGLANLMVAPIPPLYSILSPTAFQLTFPTVSAYTHCPMAKEFKFRFGQSLEDDDSTNFVVADGKESSLTIDDVNENDTYWVSYCMVPPAEATVKEELWCEPILVSLESEHMQTLLLLSASRIYRNRKQNRQSNVRGCAIRDRLRL